jgi:hypothetical protein
MTSLNLQRRTTTWVRMRTTPDHYSSLTTSKAAIRQPPLLPPLLLQLLLPILLLGQ